MPNFVAVYFCTTANQLPLFLDSLCVELKANCRGSRILLLDCLSNRWLIEG